MAFHPTTIIEQLALNRLVFDALFTAVRDEHIRYRPSPERWNMLEILCHLKDEETDDFRARLRHILNHPEQPLPPTDPSGWFTSRSYEAQDYEKKLESFLTERYASIQWLQSLESPRWDNAHDHPTAGPVTAKMILCNWLAHDLHHIRQIIHLQHALLVFNTGESLEYAGKW